MELAITANGKKDDMKQQWLQVSSIVDFVSIWAKENVAVIKVKSSSAGTPKLSSWEMQNQN